MCVGKVPCEGPAYAKALGVVTSLACLRSGRTFSWTWNKEFWGSWWSRSGQSPAARVRHLDGTLSALDIQQTHILGEKWREFRAQNRKILDDNLGTLDLHPWPQKDLNGDCPELGCTVPPHTSKATCS